MTGSKCYFLLFLVDLMRIALKTRCTQRVGNPLCKMLPSWSTLFPPDHSFPMTGSIGPCWATWGCWALLPVWVSLCAGSNVSELCDHELCGWDHWHCFGQVWLVVSLCLGTAAVRLLLLSLCWFVHHLSFFFLIFYLKMYLSEWRRKQGSAKTAE